MIKYLIHKEIDYAKWDNCIANAKNSLVYAHSWYLDVAAENWDALIFNDYEAVMPLPWKQKYGLKYIYNPIFTQQLGVFYTSDNFSDVNVFIKKIPLKFVKYHISFNNSNPLNNIKNKRINLTLSLNASYDEIKKGYNNNTKRNLKKGFESNHQLTSKISIDQFLYLTKTKPIPQLTASDYLTLEELFICLVKQNMCKIIGITDEDKNLLSAAFFVHHKSRILYLFAASSDLAKTNSSMFQIVDAVIQENANSSKVIDFEGSMQEGIARFYKGFGSKPEYYFHKTGIPALSFLGL